MEFFFYVISTDEQLTLT